MRHLVEIILGSCPKRYALHLQITLLGDVDVVHGIGPAHVECVGRAFRSQQPEVAEVLLCDVEIWRFEPDPGDILYTNDRLNHGSPGIADFALTPIRCNTS